VQGGGEERDGKKGRDQPKRGRGLADLGGGISEAHSKDFQKGESKGAAESLKYNTGKESCMSRHSKGGEPIVSPEKWVGEKSEN